MLLREFFINSLSEGQTWAKSGKKVVRKFRCTSGPRKGRVVSNISQCFAAPDVKKRMTMKKTKARLGGKMARKAKRTKKMDPASRKLQRMNKSARRL